MEDKLHKLKHKFLNRQWRFTEIKNEEEVYAIFDLFMGDILPKKTNNSTINYYLGYYYKVVKKDDKRLLKYSHKAIKKGNIDALITLGNYYKEKKEYKNAGEYYNKAREKGSLEAISYLAYNYKDMNDIEQMMYYLKEGVEKKCPTSIHCMAKYYHDAKDFENAKKYYEIAIENNNIMSMYWLGNLYSENKKYDEMLKYYELASKNGYLYARHAIAHYYLKNEMNDKLEEYCQEYTKQGDVYLTHILGQYYITNKDHKNIIRYYLTILENSAELAKYACEVLNKYISENYHIVDALRCSKFLDEKNSHGIVEFVAKHTLPHDIDYLGEKYEIGCVVDEKGKWLTATPGGKPGCITVACDCKILRELLERNEKEVCDECHHSTKEHNNRQTIMVEIPEIK